MKQLSSKVPSASHGLARDKTLTAVTSFGLERLRMWTVSLVKRESATLIWMGISLAVSLGLAVAVFAIKGLHYKSLMFGLQVTARWSFLPFWLSYSGGALTTLFGPTLAPLARHRRELGLAYAAGFLGHLGLIGVFFLGTSHLPLSGSLLAFFAMGVFWTYLLALFSFGGLAKKLGSSGWRMLRTVGVNYILYAFASDFVPAAIHSPAHYGLYRLVSYAPFALLTVMAPLLVVAALVIDLLRTSSRPPWSRAAEPAR